MAAKIMPSARFDWPALAAWMCRLHYKTIDSITGVRRACKGPVTHLGTPRACGYTDRRARACK
ncbi:MAG: hypothetical protein ABIJ56_16335 [Pseudomonadota bacterium]